MTKLQSLVVLGCTFGLVAVASAQNTAGSEAEDSLLEEVVVSSSRIVRPGFTAPTPTTVADVLKDLPSTGSSAVFGSSQGILTLNLRNLNGGGANPNGRSLFLVDGRRVVGSSRTGQVDTNMVPVSLVERIDVVTGGASAAWGSDAVAGVASVIFKKKVEGFQSSIQLGQSQRRDNQSQNAALSWGHGFGGDRGQVMAAYEYTKNYNPGLVSDRDWGSQHQGYTSQRLADGLLYQNVPTYGLTLPNLTPGGVLVALTTGATAAGGPAFGSGGGFPANGSLGSVANNTSIVFGASGAPQLLSRGSLPAFAVGTTVSSANYQVGGYGSWIGDQNTLGSTTTSTAASRQNLYLRSTYDLTSSITASFEISYMKVVNRFDQAVLQFPGGPGNLQIVLAPNNPYLVGTGLTIPANVQSVTISRLAPEIPRATQVNDGRIKNYAFGLKGRLPDNVLGKNWSWSANASHGDSLYSIKTVNNIVRQKFRASINTIRNAGGTIVCNPNSLSYLSLSAVDQAACVPSNPIGPNSFSPAAIAYFEGMLVESPNLKLDEVTASAQFDPFSTWAGAVTLFAGAEWRKEQMNTYVDDIANLAAVTTDFGQTAQGGYMYINPKSIAASPNTVTEVFGETLIPLAKDLPFVKSFGLDLAARSTNYKLSGKVTSYKGSFLYSPIDGLLIRGTNSRDIRAPALAEYFAATNTQAVNFVPNTTSFDPQQPTKAYSALGLQGGNRNLTPETATTLTLGISYSPAFVEGLSASVDYYSIKIKQAIGTIATQVILDGCGNGTLATGTTFVAGTASNPFFCNYITRAGGPNTATDIISLNAGQLLNVGLIINKGVDFELAYRVALSRLMSRLKGNMSFRVLANRIDVNNDTQSFPGGPFAISTLATLGNPRWKGTANLGYQNGPLSLNMQGTYTSGMRNLTVSPANATTIAANSFSDPSVLRIPARWYLNLTAQYALIDKGSEQLEATINVRNLFDTNPIIGFATATSASPIGLGGFDTIGRAYNLGLRFKF